MATKEKVLARGWVSVHGKKNIIGRFCYGYKKPIIDNLKFIRVKVVVEGRKA